MVDKSQDHKDREKLHLQITRADARLSAKAIQSPALPLQCVDYIHGSHSLPLGMLSVGDSIADDILQEDLNDTLGSNSKVQVQHYLEYTPGLLID